MERSGTSHRKTLTAAALVVFWAATATTQPVWAQISFPRVDSAPIASEPLLPEPLSEDWAVFWGAWSAGSLKEAEEGLVRLRETARQNGLKNLDAAALVMIQDSRRLLDIGDKVKAAAGAQFSMRLSPDFPEIHVAAGTILARAQPSQIRNAMVATISGILDRSTSFWSQLTLVANVSFIGLLAFSGVAGLFILSAIVRYGPAMIHSFSERTKPILLAGGAWVTIAAYLLVPVLAGMPVGWAVPWLIVPLWLYMAWQDRFIAGIILVTLATTPWWIGPAAQIWNASESPELRLMSKVARGVPGAQALIELTPGEGWRGTSSDWRKDFSVALHEKREGRFDSATQRYEAALAKAPDNPNVLNNLGNLQFIQRKFDAAKTYYERAIAKDPNYVAGHFNLAQTLREKLRFEEGEKHFQQAEQINSLLTKQYTTESMGPLEMHVVEARLYPRDLWTVILTPSKHPDALATGVLANLFGSVSPSRVPFYIGLAMGLAVLMSFIISRHRLPFSCGICGRTICPRCLKHLLQLRVCESCHASRSKSKGSRVLDLEQRSERAVRIAKLLSILPGAGHLYMGRSISGAVLLFLAFFLVSGVALRSLWFQVPYGAWIAAPGLNWGIVIFSMVIVYLWAYWDLSRIELLGGK